MSSQVVRRGPRILVGIVLLLAIAGLYGVLASQLRTATEADVEFVSAERRGVAYLRPLTRLVVELAKARSAAVRSDAVDSVALNAAIAGVAEADRVHGDALSTQRRWSDLRAGIEKVMADRTRGASAMAGYGDLLTLATDLARRVGDTSKLILDPELDTFYLMDAALLQLPTAIAAAGAAADHAYLASIEDSSEFDEAIPIEVVVERHRVAAANDALSTGLRKAMDETTRSALGPNLTEPLDVFRVAVDQLVPPSALRQTEAAPEPAALARAAQSVREAAMSLGTAVLTELDSLLESREQQLSTSRTYALLTAGAGVLLGVVLLWWSVPARGRSRADDLGSPDGRDESMHPFDVASVSVQLPSVDARDLLAIEELVHVGRGVRAKPKDEAGDAR